MQAIRLSALCAALLLPVAKVSAKPVVVELYTSEGCSSCPPAEALLGQLASDSTIIPLAFHVDYWNGPAWRDPFSSAAWTERQRTIAARTHTDEVYTPEMVVDGAPGFVGSDRRTALDAIAVEADENASVPVSLAREGDVLVARAGAGTGEGTLRLYGTDGPVQRAIGGGENAGSTLTEFAIVRSASDLAHWNGTPVERRVAVPAGQVFAVVLEGSDGRVLAAARSGGTEP